MVMKMVSIVILRTRNKITRDGGTMLNDGASVPRVFVWLASDIVFDVIVRYNTKGEQWIQSRTNAAVLKGFPQAPVGAGKNRTG